MKLNIDCVRDVLLEIESLPLSEPINSHDLAIRLKDYNYDDVIYSIKKLNDEKFIEALNTSTLTDCSFIIKELSWDGHQLLDTIRPQKVWDSTKEKIKSLGSTSLKVMLDVATKAAIDHVKKTMGL